MGALHAGHESLIEIAKKKAGRKGSVGVTIFVNPTQFGPKEDLALYPRPFDLDKKMCDKKGANFIFHPDPEVIYAEDHSCWVDEALVARGLCGRSRPGHFRGVCTVVLKLFNILRPDAAVFGRKDFQQLRVIQRMVRDLNLGVEIIEAPTVREKDGVAMSSRNVYLTPEERAAAPLIQKGFSVAQKSYKRGERDAHRLCELVTATVGCFPGAKMDYVELVDPETCESLDKVKRGAVMVAAAFFGTTRLIDNHIIT
jgi:pantoate--beta-alanine ligase